MPESDTFELRPLAHVRTRFHNGHLRMDRLRIRTRGFRAGAWRPCTGRTMWRKSKLTSGHYCLERRLKLRGCQVRGGSSFVCLWGLFLLAARAVCLFSLFVVCEENWLEGCGKNVREWAGIKLAGNEMKKFPNGRINARRIQYEYLGSSWAGIDI